MGRALVVLTVAGAGLVVAGVALLAPWAGFVTAGAFLCAAGLLIDDGSGDAHT